MASDPELLWPAQQNNGDPNNDSDENDKRQLMGSLQASP